MLREQRLHLAERQRLDRQEGGVLLVGLPHALQECLVGVTRGIELLPRGRRVVELGRRLERRDPLLKCALFTDERWVRAPAQPDPIPQ